MLKENTRILVTGCGGMLGEAIYLFFKDKCKLFPTDLNSNEVWLRELDVRKIEEVKRMIEEIRPDYIFHLAALTDLEYCELHQEDAYNTNALATENIALLCKEKNITLVYISTAGIFDGSQEWYNDYDFPNPLSIYGKTKYAGELAVQRILEKYFIFRAGWMIGGGPKKDKKFVNKIIKQIQEGKKEIFAIDEIFGTPTYTHDFAKNIFKIIDLEELGLYNLVCSDSCSRFDVAKEILKLIGKDQEIKLTKVHPDFFKRDFFAVRPRSEKLINLKLNLKKLNLMRNWKDSLRDYIERDFLNNTNNMDSF